MSHAIGRLDCRVRLQGNPRSTGPASQRLTAIANDRLPGALGRALDAEPSIDRGLYIFRTLRHRWRTRFDAQRSDATFADRWADSLAEAIGHCLAAGISSEQMIRFDSEAAYRAAFIRHLQTAPDSDPWWFDGLRRALEKGPDARNPAAVLRLEGAEIFDILVDLAADDGLYTLLLSASDETLHWIICACPGGPSLARTDLPDGGSGPLPAATTSDLANRLRVPFAAALALLADHRTNSATASAGRPSAGSTFDETMFDGATFDGRRSSDKPAPDITDDQRHFAITSRTEAERQDGRRSASRSLPDETAHERRAGDATAPEVGHTPPHTARDPDDARFDAPGTATTGGTPRTSNQEQAERDEAASAGTDPAGRTIAGRSRMVSEQEHRSDRGAAAASQTPDMPTRSRPARETAGERAAPAEGGSGRTIDPAGISAELFPAFVGQWQGLIDWRDRASLTDAVVSALLFLRPRIGLPEIELHEDTMAGLAARGFDWIDLARLKETLARHRANDDLAERQPSMGPGPDRSPSTDLDRPGPPASGFERQGGATDGLRQRPAAATPRQRDLIELLRDLVRDIPPAALRDEAALVRIAIGLQATATARRPELRGDPVLPSLIAACLEQWRGASRSEPADTPDDPPPLSTRGPDAAAIRTPDGWPAPDATTAASARTQSPTVLETALATVVEQLERLYRAERGSDISAPAVAAPAVGAPAVAAPSVAVPAIAAQGQWHETPNAGLFLLSRGWLDLRLHALIAECTGENETGPTAAELVLTLLLRLSRPTPQGDDDPALGLLAGLPPGADRALLHARWRACDDALLERLDDAILARATRFDLTATGRAAAWRASTASDSPSVWQAGSLSPPLVLLQAPTKADLRRRWRSLLGASSGPRFLSARDADAQRQALSRLQDGLAHGRLGLDRVDGIIERAAGLGVAAWSHWLKGFRTASLPYLQTQIFHRPGSVRLKDGQTLEVQLSPGPLHVALELSGYLETIETLPWLPGITVTFAQDRRAGP